jgi:homoserine kinase
MAGGTDTVLAERSQKTESIVEGLGAEKISTKFESNCAGLAVWRLLREPIRLTVIKGIPPGSGLGSSAASAVAAVTAVNRLLGLDLSPQDRIRQAAEGERASAGAAHADNVAAATLGGFVVVTKDAQPYYSQFKVHSGIWFCVALPDREVTTRQARAVLPKKITLAESSHAVARAVVTALAAKRGDATVFGWAIRDAVVDQARRDLIPGYEAVSQAANRAGALGVTLSGSGPAILAVSHRQEAAEDIARAMERALRDAKLGGKAFVARPTTGARVMETS